MVCVTMQQWLRSVTSGSKTTQQPALNQCCLRGALEDRHGYSNQIHSGGHSDGLNKPLLCCCFPRDLPHVSVVGCTTAVLNMTPCSQCYCVAASQLIRCSPDSSCACHTSMANSLYWGPGGAFAVPEHFREAGYFCPTLESTTIGVAVDLHVTAARADRRQHAGVAQQKIGMSCMQDCRRRALLTTCNMDVRWQAGCCWSRAPAGFQTQLQSYKQALLR